MKNATYKVYNYTPNFVAISTRNRSIGLQPCVDNVPTFEFLSMEEIEYINTQSPAIRTGVLEFEEAEREEVYEALRFPQWATTCIFERDINSLLLDSSIDSLRRIAAISDANTMERVRSHMARLMASGAEGVSSRVQRVVEQRFGEIARGALHTAIVFEQAQAPAENAELTELREQLEAMKQMMSAMAAAPAEAAPAVEAPVEEAPKEAAPAPAKKTVKSTPKKPAAPKAKKE